MKTEKKQISIPAVICWLLICLMIFLITSNLFQRAAGQVPKLFGWSKAVVVTGSMEPAIPVGSLVLIQEQPDYEVDDIITYRSASGLLITHRIIQKSASQLTAKGDSNQTNDHPISYGQVIGKVQVILPGAGRISDFLSSPGTLAVASILLIILLWIPSTKNSNQREQKRNGDQ